MAQDFYYIRPDEMWSLYASVTAAVDSDYTDDWLCDGRPGRPVRGTSGALSATIANTSGEVGMVAVVNHNLDASETVSFGGGITATVTANTPTPPNGIPLNPFSVITPVSGVTSITVSVSGNSVDVIIGEIVAGKYRTLPRVTLDSDDTGVEDFTREMDMDLSSIPPYDGGLVRRTWSGSALLSETELDEVLAWYQAQRSGSRFSLIVPRPTVNDAWACFMKKPTYRPVSATHFRVSLGFTEVARVRWP